MKQVTRYEAFDGVPFATEAECRAYEKKCAHIRLVGLTIEQVEAALSGSDTDLADAIEQVGTRIANARRERGDLRHQRKSREAIGLHKDGDPPARQITGPAASADIRADEGREDTRSVIEIIESLKDAAE